MRLGKRTLRQPKAGKGSPSKGAAGGKARLDLTDQLRRLSERLKVAEKELARMAADNARLVTENAMLRSRLESRAESSS